MKSYLFPLPNPTQIPSQIRPRSPLKSDPNPLSDPTQISPTQFPIIIIKLHAATAAGAAAAGTAAAAAAIRFLNPFSDPFLGVGLLGQKMKIVVKA